MKFENGFCFYFCSTLSLLSTQNQRWKTPFCFWQALSIFNDERKGWRKSKPLTHFSAIQRQRWIWMLTRHPCVHICVFILLIFSNVQLRPFDIHLNYPICIRFMFECSLTRIKLLCVCVWSIASSPIQYAYISHISVDIFNRCLYSLTRRTVKWVYHTHDSKVYW